MTKLSTLYLLVKNEISGIENVNLEEDLIMMEELDSDLLILAPESAVRNILGFVHSYSSIPSVLLDEIDVYKN
jgi:hypothetical protein